MIGGYHKVNGVAIRYWTWPRQPAPARYRNITRPGLLGRRKGGGHHRNGSGDAGRRLPGVLGTLESARLGQSGGRGPVRDHPQLTTDEAAHFVLAAYDDLCPVPGVYDYWAYSTS